MTKLEKLRQEHAKAKEKAQAWAEKAEEIAGKITEEEKTVIHDMMTSANLTPEQLGQLLEQLRRGSGPGEEAMGYEME